MPENIDQRLASLTPKQQRELTPLLDAVLADVTALRASILAITAKLDADDGVTDTNYAATTNPAALTVTS